MERPHQSYQEYLASLTDSDRMWMIDIIQTIREHLDPIFEFGMQYKMPSFYVPLSYFPKGYHVSKGTPLPFIAVAKQKHYLSLYHLGLYSNKELYAWFTKSYQAMVGKPISMGKSCLRFKKPSELPLSLLAELVKKITADQWIQVYTDSMMHGV
jgi:hypothetical protein